MKAFPNAPFSDEGRQLDRGMDLRDYFAVRFMTSLMINWHSDPEWDAHEMSDIAYQIADAMMKAREQ